MTSPDDDNLEERLRQALSEAAGGVEAGSDGLDKIRARIGGRRPRPWLFSVLFGVVAWVCSWTWRGHWAWQNSLPGLAALREWRSRRSRFPRWGIGWLRVVTVLAGAGVIAGVMLGVQPVRQAILQSSTSQNGSGTPPRSGADTEGNGTQANNGSGPPTGGGTHPASARAGQGSTTTSSRKTPTAAPRPTSSAGCAASSPPVAAGGAPSPTNVTPDTARTVPATRVSTPATSSPAPPAQPSPAITNVTTCPVKPTSSPTPTPAASSSSAAPTPTDVSSAPMVTPTENRPTEQPTATPAETTPAETTPTETAPTETETGTGTASKTATASPEARVASLPSPHHTLYRWHAKTRDPHSWWR